VDKPLDSSIKTRAAVSLSFALVSAYFSRAAQLYLSKSPGGDFLWAMRAGAELLQGKDPYAHSFGPYSIPYPLPAAFVGLPFSLFDPATGAGLFFGVSVGLLTYGLMVHHQTRLLIFISLPFWFALVWAQWSPLAMAAAFFPLLMPVVLIKPQIALPVAITYRTRLGTYLCIGVLLASLVLYPKWPVVWISQIGSYQRFYPWTTALGPLLFLALLDWRNRDAQLFLIASILPQRHFYDAFILWLIPRTWKEIGAMSVISWGAYIWKLNHPSMSPTEVGTVSVAFFFLPALAVILFRRYPVRRIRPH